MKRLSIFFFLILSFFCVSFFQVGAQTTTLCDKTTSADPMCVTGTIKDKSATISVLYDLKADPYVDQISVIVRGDTVGMGGGGYIREFPVYNPADGRQGKTGKKTTSFELTDLVPSTRYTVTVSARLGITEKHKKTFEFTTKKSSATNSPVGSTPTTDPVNPNNGTTGNSGSGAGAGTGTQYEVGANASTGTAPGGLVGCEGAGCSFQDLLELIKKGYSFVIKLIIPIFAIIIAYVGFLFITSGGNTEVRARAKGILTKALIGLVLILCAGLIVGLIYKAFGVKSCYNWIGKEIKDCTAQTTSQHNTWMV